MDFYKLSSKIRKARRQHMLTAGAQALFYELIAVCNEERWPDVFKCPNGELCSAINCSEKSLIQYRDELAAAELVQYQSGKSKRQPCNYSLNGCMIGYPIGLLNGGKIYSSSDSQSDSQSVEKTPDLIRHKRKTVDKDLNIEVVEEENAQARKNEIEEAIIDYASNASFDPQHAHLASEKEKNSAQKEKVLPTVEEMIDRIVQSSTCHWDNVIEFYLLKAKPLPEGVTWMKWTGQGQQEYFDWRHKLFTKFYKGKQDNYKIRLPTVTDIAQNFYNWTPSELNREKLQQLNGSAQLKARNLGNGNAKHNATGNRDERNNSIADIISQSEDFLQQYSDPQY